jgi:rubrerythrin
MKEERKKGIKELEEMIEVILLSIPREIASQKFYQIAFEKATTDTSRKFFLSLVKEEKRHEANLRKILNELQNELKKVKELK